MKSTKSKHLKNTTVCALLIAASMLMPSCSSKQEDDITLPPDISISGTADPHETGTSSEKETSSETVVLPTEYEYRIDISEYLDYITLKNTDARKYLKLINKTHTVGEDYAPEKGEKTDSSITLYGKEVYLEEYTAKAAYAMIAEMRAYGFDDVYITSGFRSYRNQSSLYYTYFNSEKSKHPTWTDEQVKAKVLTYSAYPGTSEHQSGLCLDLFISPGMTELVNYGSETDNQNDIGFAESDEYKWLCENAHKFGFILRFGEDKVNLTGYSYESWHFRFVGREAATKIYASGQCLEEYLGEVD